MIYNFGGRLKELRVRNGWTQKDVAERINKSVAAVSSYELDLQVPPIDVATSIAILFNTSLDYLVGLEHDKIYSVGGLTEDEKYLVELLFSELSNPSTRGNSLSVEQINILQKLIIVFLRKEE